MTHFCPKTASVGDYVSGFRAKNFNPPCLYLLPLLSCYSCSGNLYWKKHHNGQPSLWERSIPPREGPLFNRIEQNIFIVIVTDTTKLRTTKLIEPSSRQKCRICVWKGLITLLRLPQEHRDLIGVYELMDLTFQIIQMCDVSVSLTVLFSADTVRKSGKITEEAVVDEEAILSLLENSQTFLSVSQTSSHSPLLGMVAKLIGTQLYSAHFLLLLLSKIYIYLK